MFAAWGAVVYRARWAVLAAHTDLHDLPPSAVRSVTSYWDAHAPQLVTADHRRALASVTISNAPPTNGSGTT